ncbi:hypothetical protein [Kitasatospora cathayae]|uniref:Uncharacterized protein n=1 Tax=Kitasatospora cathayae TaxID=3004092 RepID=A0ABY7Q5D9_9ACTN|nr:hypothetical protein [Kitasatospora sp. HUAS 3-15]WBP87932.1 hypothetical protein O1G21_20190 [Kitasatospora sp. HUAS 3-15]
MIRTRIALAAAVATLALGVVGLIPSAVVAAPQDTAAGQSAPAPGVQIASPDTTSWGG